MLTELQVGSYIFSDVIYDGVAMTAEGDARFRERAIRPHAAWSAPSTPASPPTTPAQELRHGRPGTGVASGAPPGSTYARAGDEFGRVVLPDPDARLPVGTLLACIVPHCDPTVNLYDRYHCVRGDRLVEVWPIEARGRSD